MLYCLVLVQKPANRLTAAFVSLTLKKSFVNNKEFKQNNYIFHFSFIDNLTDTWQLRWSSGTRVRGFKPSRSRWIFRASEISSACLPSEGNWKNLSHVPALRHVQEPSTFVNCECASKIPCIVPSFASRGLSSLCGAWRLWRWMRETHWGQGYNRPTGCSAEKAQHATINF